MDIAGVIAEHQAVAIPALILLMMAESLPVIGFLIPGAFILPAIGMLSGSGNGSFVDLYLYAVTGSLSGDMLGYWFGRNGGREWQPALLRSRHRQFIKFANNLVSRHGGVAVFLGRFAWLIHPAIPMAAGLLGVKLRTFMVFDTLAVCLWVLLYLGAGHIVTGFWVNRTFEFFQIITAVIIVAIVLYAIHYRIGRLSGHE